MFEVPITWNIQESAGFEYDTTLGYSRQVGFRSGICFPYHAYDVLNEKKHELIEIPLVVSDEPLSRLKDLKIATKKIEEFLQEVKRSINIVKRYNGCMVVLWHPFQKYLGCISAYEKVLEYLKESGAHIMTCEEIVEWWKQRNLRKK
jgi:hypothetical protein